MLEDADFQRLRHTASRLSRGLAEANRHGRHLSHGIMPVQIDAEPPLQLFRGCEKPQNMFITVCYEGYWYWIEKSDFRPSATSSTSSSSWPWQTRGPRIVCP